MIAFTLSRDHFIFVNNFFSHFFCIKFLFCILVYVLCMNFFFVFSKRIYRKIVLIVKKECACVGVVISVLYVSISITPRVVHLGNTLFASYFHRIIIFYDMTMHEKSSWCMQKALCIYVFVCDQQWYKIIRMGIAWWL